MHVETIFGVLSLIPLISICILSPFIFFFSLVSPSLPIFSLPTCLPDISCSTNIYFHTYLLVHIPSNQLAITFWHRVWFQEADIHHSDAAPLNVSIVRCIVKNIYYYNVYYSLLAISIIRYICIILLFSLPKDYQISLGYQHSLHYFVIFTLLRKSSEIQLQPTLALPSIWDFCWFIICR